MKKAKKSIIIDNIKELNETEKDLFNFIYNCNNKSGYCAAYTKTILKALNITLDEFREALKTLISFNFIRIEYYNTFRYILVNNLALRHYEFLQDSPDDDLDNDSDDFESHII